MVGGMLLHLKSLRKFQHTGGWIKALLEEAENERMHLMTMVELVKPSWHERLLVITAQGVFFNAFFVFYILSPKTAHRFVGYLEEEAVISYTQHLNAIESGKVENVPAPAIAIDYWRLPKDATLKDVITVIRADEAHHRDVNHFASVSVKLSIIIVLNMIFVAINTSFFIFSFDKNLSRMNCLEDKRLQRHLICCDSGRTYLSRGLLLDKCHYSKQVKLKSEN
jgi:demethoxyubiquinone hydroxylase (CLK1/Coq7/Cat5 family)